MAFKNPEEEVFISCPDCDGTGFNPKSVRKIMVSNIIRKALGKPLKDHKPELCTKCDGYGDIEQDDLFHSIF